MNKKASSAVTRERERRAEREREMTPSNEIREEIRGKRGSEG